MSWLENICGTTSNVLRLTLGEHFVRRYPQVAEATIAITERGWDRLQSNGTPHPHAFQRGSDARRYTRVVCTAKSSEVQSGIRDLVISEINGVGVRGLSEMREHDAQRDSRSNSRHLFSSDLAFRERARKLSALERRDSGRHAENLRREL